MWPGASVGAGPGDTGGQVGDGPLHGLRDAGRRSASVSGPAQIVPAPVTERDVPGRATPQRRCPRTSARVAADRAKNPGRSAWPTATPDAGLRYSSGRDVDDRSARRTRRPSASGRAPRHRMMSRVGAVEPALPGRCTPPPSRRSRRPDAGRGRDHRRGPWSPPSRHRRRPPRDSVEQLRPIRRRCERCERGRQIDEQPDHLIATVAGTAPGGRPPPRKRSRRRGLRVREAVADEVDRAPRRAGCRRAQRTPRG
jgi:hypothetical protein